MIYVQEEKSGLEELITTTVGGLLEKLEPWPFDSWGCLEEDEIELRKMDPNTRITCFGDYRFRLADDYPSYFVREIRIDR